jgi:hypothetical protein
MYRYAGSGAVNDGGKMPRLLILLLSVLISMTKAENQSGVVKISPLPEKACTEPVMNPRYYFNPHDTVYFYIDGKKDFSAKNHCGLIDLLDRTIRHTVVLKVHNKVKASFFFSFIDEKSDTVCLWYYPCYGTWSVVSRNNQCDCKRKMPEHNADSAKSAIQNEKPE